jgi:hypothetical protein
MHSITQIRQPKSVLGGHRHWIAKTQLIGLQISGLGRFATFTLVCYQDDWFAGTAHNLGKGSVVSHDAGARIHHKKDQVSFADGDIGLLAHAALQRLGPGDLETSSIDNIELQVIKLGGVDATVAGDARRIIDQRKFATGQTVKKGRLADVGPADNGDLECHLALSGLCAAAANQFRHQRGALDDVAGSIGAAVICSNSFSASLSLPSFHADRANASRADARSGLVSDDSGSARWATSE